VLDASIAIKWFNLHESLADKQGLISLCVPTFWEYEVANGLNKAVARGQLTEAEGQDAMSLLLTLPVQKEPLPSPQESYGLARKYQRSVYDSWYLALAENTGCEFWTADQKLYNALKNITPWVRWLADYQSHS
jgi:predicted nucleic acid-binding protein